MRSRRSARLVASTAAVLLVAACGSSSSGGSSAQPSGGASATSSSPTFTVTVVGDKVTGVPARVTMSPGEAGTLIVTADRTSELHLHAAEPEVETHTSKGQPVTVHFTAQEQPGLYEVEMHDPDLLLFQVEVK